MRVLVRAGETFKQVFDCGQCKSKLEADESDLRCYPGDFREAESFYVLCAVCGRQRFFDPNGAPEMVKRKARGSK